MSIARCPNLAPLAFLACFALAAYASAGNISYDAPGHFNPDEGTIEVWFTATVDNLYPEPDGEYQHVFSLFNITVPDDWSAGCTWYARPSRKGMKMSISSKRMSKGMAGLIGSDTPQDWKPGERHRATFTWRGREMRLYADGKLISSREQLIPFTGPVGSSRLVIGATDRDSRVVIHAVRVSCIARTAEQIADAQPTADLAVTLLDCYTAPPADGRVTNPEVRSAMSSTSGGVIAGAVHWSDEHKGLALYSAR